MQDGGRLRVEGDEYQRDDQHQEESDAKLNVMLCKILPAKLPVNKCKSVPKKFNSY